MHKRRSLFVTGILLSALVLFGSTTVSAQITVVAADPAITTVQAVALDHESIRVRWATDTVANEPTVAFITGFEIRYQERGTATTVYDVNEPSMYAEAEDDERSVLVDGLDHSTAYVFQVRAIDDEGTAALQGNGLWRPNAVPAVVETTEVAEVPDQVEDLNLVPMDMMIMATWDEADTDRDFPITGYQLTIEPEDGPTDTTNIGPMTEYTFEGLMNGTEYTVTVAGRNEIGLGDPSDEEMATPTAATPTPALPVFGAFALGAGLLAAGRRRLRRRQQLLNS